MGQEKTGFGVDRREVFSVATLGLALSAVGAPRPAKGRVGPDAGEVSTPAEAIVETDAGRVRGYRRNGIYTYKGIPYGADTGGPARFLKATKPAPWSGVRDTIAYGPVSPQARRRDWGQQQTQFVYDWDDGFDGEDCLCLNVWSGSLDPNARRPVMVWLHGGGFSAGSGQELPSYDGESLARRGVVLVSINHRLGPLGFLDVSQLGSDAYRSSGNASILDMILALQWVRANIATFGGDPSRVTIFGQSGGGAKVSSLMAAPLAKGLFHRAIVQSGGFTSSNSATEAQALTDAVVRELGLTGDKLAGLRDVTPARLIEASGIAMAKLGGVREPIALGKPLRFPKPYWGPVVDGVVYESHPWQDHAPEPSREVPLIIGTTREEFRDPTSFDISWNELTSRLSVTFGAKASAIVDAFKSDFPAESAQGIAGIIGGITWRSDAIRFANLKAAQGGAPCYNYWFTWQPKVLDGRPGAFHCLDLAFCFDNTARCAQATGNTAAAQNLANDMSAAWVSFAATGNPSTPARTWPKFDQSSVPTMIFDNQVKVANDPAGTARRTLLPPPL